MGPITTFTMFTCDFFAKKPAITFMSTFELSSRFTSLKKPVKFFFLLELLFSRSILFNVFVFFDLHHWWVLYLHLGLFLICMKSFFFDPLIWTGNPPKTFPLPRMCDWIAVGRSKSFRGAVRVFEWVCPRLWSHAAWDGGVQSWPAAVWRNTAGQAEAVQRHRKRLGRFFQNNIPGIGKWWLGGLGESEG